MEDIGAEIAKYLSERGWQKERPVDIAKSICIEAAELLELFQWTNDELEEVKKNKEMVNEIQKELADVFIYAFVMSVLLEFNIKDIIKRKIAYIKKKYPAKLMKENPNRNFGSLYYQLKTERRYKLMRRNSTI